MILNLSYFYFSFFLFLMCVFLIFFFFVSFIFITKKKTKDLKKKSLYECGFESFAGSQHLLPLNFVLIALLYIIFDLEVLFLVPWILVFPDLSFIGSMTFYIVGLSFILGFLYELLSESLSFSSKKFY